MAAEMFQLGIAIVDYLNKAMDLASKLSTGSKSKDTCDDLTEIRTQISMAQGLQLRINSQYFTLSNRAAELEKQIIDLKAWGEEKSQYKLTPIGTTAFVYAPKPDSQQGQTPHWICAHCYNRSEKSILQAMNRPTGANNTIWACPACKSQVVAHYTYNPSRLANG